MSEISKIGRAMEMITPVVMSMSSEKLYTPSSLGELQDILRKLQGYRGTCDNALLKLDEKDPVTQTPRYGPKMVQKIQSLDVNLKTILELTDSLISENISALEEAQKSSPPPPKIEIIETQVPGKVEEVSAVHEEQETSAVDLGLLSAQAEEIRQKKRKQQMLERSQQELEIHTFIGSVDTLNSLWFRRDPDRSHILSALRSLRTEAPSPDDFLRISTFVTGILENISKRPDDEKLRRIRINHSFIQTLFGGSWLQSVTLLLSVGFLGKPVLASGEPIPTIPSRETAPISPSTTEVQRNLRDVLWREGSQFTLLLEMSEPSLGSGSGGSGDWIKWFDGLKESISFVSEGSAELELMS